MPDEIIISNKDMKSITLRWLVEADPKEKKRLAWLLLLYRNPNVRELAKQLEITPTDLLLAVEQILNEGKNAHRIL